jgi:type I restriction enzyme S subunit
MNSIKEKNLREISGFESTPNGWSEKTIDEICNIGRGRVISLVEIKSNPGDYPVFSSQTRDKGKMGSIGTYDFDGDYVTWTTDGENAGTVFYRTGKFNCTNVCGTLKAKNSDEIDLQFLSYHLGRIAKKYVSYIGNPKLMNGVMANVGLVLPKIDSQKKIAQILTTIDQLIEKTQALIDKHTAIKQGMMADLFTRGIDPTTGQLRPPVEQAPHLYKETELGWVPKDWDFCSLSEYGTWQGGMTPSKSIDAYWQRGDCLWISPKDVRGDAIIDSEDKITNLAIKNSCLQILPAGTILIVFRSGILRNKIPVSYVNRPFTVNQDIKTLVPNKEFHNKYCFYLLKSREEEILRKFVKSGTTVESIDGEAFFKMPCPKPHINEQKLISKILDSIDSKIKHESEAVKKYKLKKYGLMQDLLTGKVKVA